jgi:hypothetical protein
VNKYLEKIAEHVKNKHHKKTHSKNKSGAKHKLKEIANSPFVGPLSMAADEYLTYKH